MQPSGQTPDTIKAYTQLYFRHAAISTPCIGRAAPSGAGRRAGGASASADRPPARPNRSKSRPRAASRCPRTRGTGAPSWRLVSQVVQEESAGQSPVLLFGLLGQLRGRERLSVNTQARPPARLRLQPKHGGVPRGAHVAVARVLELGCVAPRPHCLHRECARALEQVRVAAAHHSHCHRRTTSTTATLLHRSGSSGLQHTPPGCFDLWPKPPQELLLLEEAALRLLIEKAVLHWRSE